MNNTERILASIDRVLTLSAISPDLDGRELAQEYAALCLAANERLLQCVRHIERGNLRAAMHISESPPPILDHCAALDFSGAAQWQAFAQKNNWPLAETINARATQQINDAYSSALALDPFLKQFANAALQKNYCECTRLLRRIIELDPKTPTWPEDLKAFEDRRIPEVTNELHLADAEHSLVKLNKLFGELSEKWLDPRSKVLQEQVGAAVQRVQEKEASERGLEIVVEISKNYAAFDYKGLECSLSAYQALLDKGHFKPAPAMAIQFDEANAWFEQEKASKEKERQYQDNLAQLVAELEKEPSDGKTLEKLWRVLTSDERSLPADLEQRTLNTMETCRLLDQRRKRRQVTLIAVAAVLVMVGIAAVICRVQYRQLLTFYVPQLEQAMKQNDLQKLLSLKTDIQKHILIGRFLYRSPLVQEWLRQENATSILVTQNTRRFKELIADLERIAHAGFTDDTAFVRGHAEASKILNEVPALRSSPSQQENLNSLAEMRRVHWESKIAQKEVNLQGIITDLLRQLPSFESIESGSLGDLEQKMTALDSLVVSAQGKASELRVLYTNLNTQGSGVLASMESTVREVNARQKAITERQSLIAKLGNAESLPDYLVALQSYVDRFPRDQLSQAMVKVIASRKDCEYFIAPPLITPVGLNTAQLESISDSTPTENYFWDSLLVSEVHARKGIEQKWPNIKKSILAFADDKQMVGLIEFTFKNSEGKLIRVFAYDDFGKKKTGVVGMEMFDVGTVYVPKADHIRAKFKPFTSGVKSTLVINRKPMAHCAIITNLIADAKKVNATEGGVFLLKAAFEINNNDNILNPLLKLKLAKLFLVFFVEMVGNGVVPEIDAALTEMDLIDDGNLDPFCIYNPFVIDAGKKADGVMRKIFKDTSLIGKFQFQEAIRRECVRRGAQWVGHVDFNDPSSLRLVIGKKAFEIWVLRPGTGKEMNVLAVAEWGPANKYMIGEKLTPGESLFAPTAKDARTTRNILDRILKKTSVKKIPKNMAWPPAWPVNRRQ